MSLDLLQPVNRQISECFNRQPIEYEETNANKRISASERAAQRLRTCRSSYLSLSETMGVPLKQRACVIQANPEFDPNANQLILIQA
ncbi:MAG TPA: hypothetical protein VGE46_00340 [Bdellovibrio sp.]